MGDQEQEDSMNSSSSEEEVDRPEDQENNEVGTGRSYECVFCKRGFTTAQALGGHMNIHRKDRAKNRPNSTNKHSQKHEDQIYASHRVYEQISSYPSQRYFGAQEAQLDYHHRTYIPASTSAARASHVHHSDDYYDRNLPQRFNPFGDDWRVSLSLQLSVEDKDQKKRSEEEELDLELRLGQNP